ncbi:MAG: MBL fold metallo-hydrolase [bacterium]|nr:MBL fold metallo-hydrolase [bacterium]
MKLTFYGGAMSVTGANYLLEFKAGGKDLRVLVDCGLFQGSKFVEGLNYAPFGYDASTIDYLFITHSHADHVGRVPKLYKEGFRGKIYVVEPTRNLMLRALPDSWNHIAEEAKSDGHPPLYELGEVDAALDLIETVKYHQSLPLAPGVTATYYNSGHVLGSGIICFEYEEEGERRKIYFTGDLGNSPSLLLPDKEFVEDADYVVIDSAYGSRTHEDKDSRSQIFRQVLEHVVKSKGTMLVPSFAIERTQEILFELHQLFQNESVPMMPVFIDSPLAHKMTEVYNHYQHYLNENARSHFLSEGRSIFDFSCLRFTDAVEQSKSINAVEPPKVIIAGSGMSVGGRILHHERRYLSDPRNAIVFVGYQVEGSLGRKILEGAKEVSIFGEMVPVRCLVKGIGGYSAHADQPALVDWITQANKAGKLKKVFMVQGEENSGKALADIVKNKLKVEAIVPIQDQQFDL